jgi:hypothetical protein
MHGNDREQARSASTADEHLLVVELLEVALDRLPAAQWPTSPGDPLDPALPDPVPEPEPDEADMLVPEVAAVVPSLGGTVTFWIVVSVPFN